MVHDIQKDIKYEVFISYAKKDEIIAQKIHSMLFEKGFKVWIDKYPEKTIYTHQSNIENKIESSKWMLVLLSHEYLNDLNLNYIINERLKLDNKKREKSTIIPIILKKFEYNYGKFSELFNNINKINAFEENYIEQIIRKIRKYKYDVFISYTNENFIIAKTIYQFLENNYFNVWFDEQKIEVADTLEKKIIKAIKRSEWMIALLTREYFIKKYTTLEIEHKLIFDKRKTQTKIIPIFIEDFKLESADSILDNKSIDILKDIANINKKEKKLESWKLFKKVVYNTTLLD